LPVVAAFSVREAQLKHTVQKFSRKMFWILVALGTQVPILGAQATVILPEVHNGSTVWTGSNPLALDAAEIGAIVGKPGLGLFYDVQVRKAQIATTGGTESQVLFTVRNETVGDGVTVEVLNPGTHSTPLSISVTGRTITITLATDAAGVPISTAAQVAAAVNAAPAASALVAASAGGSGTGLVQILSATALEPVIVETGPFAGAYQTAFANSTSFPQDASVTYGSGAAIGASALFLYVRDTGHAPAFYIYDLHNLLAPAFSWNGLDDLRLERFWPNDGAIEQVSIVGIASRSTPVPESSSLALLLLGIGVLSWSRRRA
jgi:hypothetical protein